MTSCTCARVRVDDAASAALRVGDPPAVTFGTGEYVPYVPQMDEFPGPYEVTPTNVAQTLATRGLLSTADIVINPIPSNYGLIQWNGAVLTVS